VVVYYFIIDFLHPPTRLKVADSPLEGLAPRRLKCIMPLGQGIMRLIIIVGLVVAFELIVL